MMTKLYIKGVVLVELVVFITIAAILLVTLFSTLTRNINDKLIDFNDMVLITNNSEEVFHIWTNKLADIRGIKTCDTFPNITNPLLCKINLGDNVKYTIEADYATLPFESDFNIPPLQNTTITTINLSVIFYTRQTTTSSWSQYTTMNRTFKVLK